MLVLSRKMNESIIIGDNKIVITVVDIRGDNVRIGIVAPKEITVHREEVFRAIKKQEEEIKASENSASNLLAFLML